MNKECYTCKEEKDISEFSPRYNSHKYNIGQSSCKECTNIQSKARYRKKERHSMLHNSMHKQRYGLDETSFYSLIEGQNKKCAICAKDLLKNNCNVDHCHSTGKVRGLLCRTCNQGLGMFKDDKDLLQRAINYL